PGNVGHHVRDKRQERRGGWRRSLFRLPRRFVNKPAPVIRRGLGRHHRPALLAFGEAVLQSIGELESGWGPLTRILGERSRERLAQPDEGGTGELLESGGGL